MEARGALLSVGMQRHGSPFVRFPVISSPARPLQPFGLHSAKVGGHRKSFTAKPVGYETRTGWGAFVHLDRLVSTHLPCRVQRFVEGYVRERRRYLNRRVAAQRDGHGSFKREEVPVGPGGRRPRKVVEAAKAEFSVSGAVLSRCKVRTIEPARLSGEWCPGRNACLFSPMQTDPRAVCRHTDSM